MPVNMDRVAKVMADTGMDGLQAYRFVQASSYLRAQSARRLQATNWIK